MEWTKEQKDAIDARGQNLLVSAAAGSGKTAVLSERVSALVKEGIPLDRMLIISFTNAAAAEMKDRIMKNVGLDPFAKSSICTFDKFAIEIYRNYYHIIDMPPGLKICDQYKQQIFRTEALDEMFEERLESGDQDFRDFLMHYCSPRRNDTAREMIAALHGFIQSMPYPMEWLDQAEKLAFSPQDLIGIAAKEAAAGIEAAAECIRDAQELLSGCDDGGRPLTPGYAEKNAVDLGTLESISELLAKNEIDSAFTAIAGFKAQTMRGPKSESSAYEAVKEDVAELRNKAKGIIKDVLQLTEGLDEGSLDQELSMVQPYVKELCLLVRDFDARYSAKKLKAGLMDFSDAEHFALRILDDEAVREELRDSYDCIFVDEYQDSNYVQEALIERISRGNNVFMVGDIKQSIYKFRLAEPEIFLGKYKDFRKGEDPLSRAIDLNRNYRSKRTVIDLVNNVFRRVMTRQTVNMDYDDKAELVEGAPYTGEYSYEPRLYLISTESDADDEVSEEIEELKAEELEALNAARVIREYHGRMVNIKGTDRKLAYRDMAILLRAAKNRGELYYQALQQSGIPVFLERGEGYFDTPEIQVFLNLLRIIDNPHQDVPLISVMHFPCFGFSAAQLATIKAEGRKTAPRASFYDTVKSFAYSEGGVQQELFGGRSPETELTAKKAADFLERIAFWRRKCTRIPLADFIWELMHESGIAGYAQALPGGAQRIANLRAMADKAQVYESETSGGIGGFVSYIEFAAENGKVDTGQVKLLTESDDVVRIMTIHKSKGLEFPFVLIAGMAQGFRGQSSMIPQRMHRNYGISLKLTNPVKGLRATPKSYRLIESVLKGEDFAETIRILYVAMTRARDILVMSAAVKDGRSVMAKRGRIGNGRAFLKTYLDMVLPSMPMSCVQYVTREELMKPQEEASQSTAVWEGIEHGFKISEEKLPISIEELRARLEYDHSPDPASMLKKKYSVSEIAELKRSRLPETPGNHRSEAAGSRTAYRASGLSGAEKGTAYHSVMEHLPFTAEGKSPEEIASFIVSLKEKNIISSAEAEAVDPDRVAAFFRSDIGKRAVASDELYKEAPFLLKTELDGREILVQGVIDCYFREGGRYVLVDYKSNYVDRNSPESEKERLRDTYEPQLELYREALENILGVEVSESVLYLFGLDDIVTVTK